MGWYYSHRDKGMTTIDYLVADGALVREKVKASSTQNGVCYIAYEFEPGRTTAFVFLTNWASGYYNFGYKPMEESMGPNECTASKKVMEALSPLKDLFTPSEEEGSYQWAKRWREECWANLNKPKLKPGDTVRFAQPLEFTNGDKLDTFTYEKGSRFRSGYGVYTITKYKDRDFEVVNA